MAIPLRQLLLAFSISWGEETRQISERLNEREGERGRREGEKESGCYYWWFYFLTVFTCHCVQTEWISGVKYSAFNGESYSAG